ncbi:MAG: heavy-metal-associated domain-containing protein [Dysgonomonas sp.]
MKTKILFLTAILFASISFSLSAQKKNNKQIVVYDVSMTCDNCKKRIEKNIAFEKGVTDMVVDLPAKTVTIEYQENKTDTAKLKKAIEKLGYTATVHTSKGN